MQFCPRYAGVFLSLSPDFQSGHIIFCPLAAVIHHPLFISSAFYAVIHRPLSRMPFGRPIWRPVRANSMSAKSSSFFRNFMRIPYKMKIFLAYIEILYYLCSKFSAITHYG